MGKVIYLNLFSNVSDVDCTTRNPVIHAILFKQIDGYKMFLEIFVICFF